MTEQTNFNNWQQYNQHGERQFEETLMRRDMRQGISYMHLHGVDPCWENFRQSMLWKVRIKPFLNADAQAMFRELWKDEYKRFKRLN